MKQDAELEPFAKFIEALDPWLGQVVLIGGWAHRLYRLDARAQNLTYPPLVTLDGDVAVPEKLVVKGSTIRDRLLAAGFQEEFVGEGRPPATHYHLPGPGGFYAEFLTPLLGSEYDRRGKRKATREVAGVSLQQLRYVEVLLVSPWKVGLSEGNGYPFKSVKHVQVANPASFLAQKILIHQERSYRDRAKDILYIHDTIETFSGHLAELREMFVSEIRKRIHTKRVREMTGAANGLFGKMNDTIREAVVMAAGRNLNGEALVETCRAGLREIFR